MLIDTTCIEDTNVSGIYIIKSTLCDKCYIGSTVNIRKRYNDHKNELLKGIHKNNKLQKFYNKYGQNSLIFEVLMYCHENDLILMEQYYINRRNNYFNISKIAGNTIGVICSEETKKKISESNKGRKLTPEHIAKSTAHFKGISLSPEHRKKIGLSQKNNVEAMRVKREKLQGEGCRFAKLKESDILTIRKDSQNGINNKTLSIRYNVSENTICNIKHYQTWKHVV